MVGPAIALLPVMRIPSLLACVLAALALAFLSGCSVIGLCVGAAVPMYKPVEPAHAESIPPGTDVEIEASAPRSGDPTEHVTGKLASVDGGHLSVVSPDDNHVHDVRLGRVRELNAKTASYWPVGLFAGALIDVVVVALAVTAYQKWESTPLGLGGLGTL